MLLKTKLFRAVASRLLLIAVILILLALHNCKIQTITSQTMSTLTSSLIIMIIMIECCIVCIYFGGEEYFW
jgi:hypothetical protein